MDSSIQMSLRIQQGYVESWTRMCFKRSEPGNMLQLTEGYIAERVKQAHIKFILTLLAWIHRPKYFTPKRNAYCGIQRLW